MKTIEIQRLRNWTTGILHTEVKHLYQDIETITGEPGIMTHHLPNALEALKPWLKSKYPEPRLWENTFDTSHVGEVELVPMNDQERAEFFQRFDELPSPFAGRLDPVPKEG